MPDLSTNYMGIALRNPIMVSSSSLTNSLDGVKRSADAGAGAVVLKSLFEEQIDADIDQAGIDGDSFGHPDAEAYLRQMGLNHGPGDYLATIEAAKRETDIPVIASVNCVSNKWWTRYARQIQEAGADAIELNLSVVPSAMDEPSDAVEKRLVAIVDRVRGAVDIPIAAKIGATFTAIPYTCRQLRKAGASALVLFNRFYQMDIDLGRMEVAPGVRFSNPEEIALPLRWIAILYQAVGCDLAASTGIHDADAVVKQLLAGATVTQVCSTVYKNGYGRITELVDGLSAWMSDKRYARISEFRGRISRSESSHPDQYDRLQYIKAITGLS